MRDQNNLKNQKSRKDLKNRKKQTNRTISEKGGQGKWYSEEWKADLIPLGICLLFYLIFPLLDGPVWCADSPSYATMNITREPLYPTFLWIFRSVFGEEAYRMPVVLFQSVLAGYASWKLGMTVKEMTGGNRLLGLCAIGFQLFVTFLCRFVANRGSAYTDSIMTEGLGLSLYLLFVLQLYQYMYRDRVRHLAAASVLAVLLVNLRKQMMISLCLMAAVFILYHLVKRQHMQRLLYLLGLTVSLLLISKLTDRFYNYQVRDAWIEHSGNSMGMLCNLLYTSDPEDAELFQDPVRKELFLQIREEMESQQLAMSYAPKDWEGLTTHYADSYDAIGYGILNPVIQGYLREQGQLTEVEEAQQYDALCEEMTASLLKQEKKDLFIVLGGNTLKGFVNSVARMHPLLNPAALFVYVLYLVLYLVLLLTGKKWQLPDRILTFAEIVLGGIVINCLVVGVMIFCQPRYMIYSMGLFYSALLVMGYELVRIGRSAKKESVMEHEKRKTPQRRRTAGPARNSR